MYDGDEVPLLVSPSSNLRLNVTNRAEAGGRRDCKHVSRKTHVNPTGVTHSSVTEDAPSPALGASCAIALHRSFTLLEQRWFNYLRVQPLASAAL